MKSKINLNEIKLLVLDVDGVLTNGDLVINADGSESKIFNSLDGHGIKLFKRAGLEVAFLSGRESVPTGLRAMQLGVDFVYQDIKDKLPKLQELMKMLSLKPEEVAYMGDDLPDLPPIRYVGFGITVANAVEEVKQHADYVTKASGGSGAVREVTEYLLKQTGRWDDLMRRYLI